MIEKGMSEIEVVDFFEENQPTVNIKLDVNLTASENASAYFKKYTKKKRQCRLYEGNSVGSARGG